MIPRRALTSTSRTRSGRSRPPDRPRRGESRRAGRGRPQAAPTPSPLQPALREGFLGDGLPVLQAHERDPVSDLLLPVPRAVLGDEDLAPVLGREHRPLVKAHAEGRDVRGPASTRAATKSRQGNSLPNSGSGTSPPWQYGKPKWSPSCGARFSSSGGLSSPSQSRPLSVNHSSFVSGCQSNPTVFRTPRATISKPDPSGLRRVIEA